MTRPTLPLRITHDDAGQPSIVFGDAFELSRYLVDLQINYVHEGGRHLPQVKLVFGPGSLALDFDVELLEQLLEDAREKNEICPGCGQPRQPMSGGGWIQNHADPCSLVAAREDDEPEDEPDRPHPYVPSGPGDSGADRSCRECGRFEAEEGNAHVDRSGS